MHRRFCHFFIFLLQSMSNFYPILFSSRSFSSAVKFCAFAVILSSLLIGCGGGNSGQSDSDSAKLPTVMPDTFAVDSATDKLVESKDSVVKKPTHIRSKEEIRQFIADSPHKADYEAGIIPTIAEYVPEYASKLLDNTTNGFIIVDKNTMKLYRYDKYGRELENVGIACSRNYGTKHTKGDNRTPEGFFTIEGIYDSTDWLYTNDAGYTSPARGQFGPRYMRLRTPVTSQVGIHGTAAPGSIGGRRSHGCIRMTNENILRIHKLCTSGMPVIVSPGPRDMAVNQKEGYNVPAVPVVKGGVPCVAGKYSAKDLESGPSASKPSADKTSRADSVASGAPASAPAVPAVEEPSVPAPVAPVSSPSAEPSPQTSAPANTNSPSSAPLAE